MLMKVLIAVCALLVGRLLIRRRQPSTPPGPRGWPLIGNLLDFPTSHEWEVFAKWGEKWGDLLSVSVFGTTIVVINSYERCQEMLEKKSNVYSERPYVPMPMDLIEMRDSMGFLPYDNRLKSCRRLFHQELGGNSRVREFFPKEEHLSRQFLRRVLNNPDSLLDHCFQHSGAIILRVAYGYEVQESNDPFVNLANTAMDNFNRATAPGSFLVNQLPILLKVPDWFPGTEWKRIGRAWAKDYWALVDEPFNFVKKQLSEGIAEDSFTAKWLKQNISPEEEFDLKIASSSMFGAGSETTAVTIYVFFLAMAMFPEAQKRAQAELNSVTGQDRLPSFEDRDRLPYVEAVCKEVMRYHAVVPNGLPHCTAREDIHEGMFIPKGAIIFANIWNMTRDPKVYKNPMEFNPDRFLGDAPEQDPKEMVFGFGKRPFAGDASIFITLAMSLAAFKVTPLDGEEPLSLKSVPGIISHIHPFKCRIVPSMDKEKLLDLIHC
ncbi:cytochrome P450 [Gymnopus androsaceus JB14]|uniref:Cytochrome P450 n=1 Tax=Gymnopus androsaceus JB14 TaxID=1447944 RepID=A0A6A4HM38_9AGAR|nr:cytochrome P450 [Gymnopus androsaceus JB14]